MEEEAEKKKEARMEAWGRDDFSVYKMHPGETVEIQVNAIALLFISVQRHNCRKAISNLEMVNRQI